MSGRAEKNAIFDEAVRWISRFADGTAKSQAFFAWLAESPRHVEELGFALALSAEIAGLAVEKRAEIEKLAAQPSDGLRIQLADNDLARANVIPLVRTAVNADTTAFEPHGRWKMRMLAASIAAVTAIVLIATYRILGPHAWHTYATQVGEQRTLTLADGSIVQLNTRSRLKVRFNPTTREIWLLDGQALFKVQPDAARAFRVLTSDAVIQAVGTQFDVYRRGAGTRVSVLEGVVQVASVINSRGSDSATTLLQEQRGPVVRAMAGERIDIGFGARTVQREVLKQAEATAWRQRRLVFDNDSLADIALEFNRYNRAPRISIEGQSARKQRFAGTFDADAPEALLAALADHRDLEILRDADEIVIRARSIPNRSTPASQCAANSRPECRESATR